MPRSFAADNIRSTTCHREIKLNKYKREISLDRSLTLNAQLTTRERERGQTDIFFRWLVLKALVYDRYGQAKGGTGRNTMIASQSGPLSLNAG